MELMRISPDYVSGSLTFLWRFLRIPAFRCEPCRHKYFSILPVREISEEAANFASSD